MAHMEFFVVSEDLSVDQQTNRLSLFNVLEQISGTNFPLVLKSFAAITLWVKEAADEDRDFQCMLRIIMPNGRQHNFTSNFKFVARRHRVVQRFEGFPIDEPGILRFEVLLNGEPKASHEVEVSRIDASDLPPITEVG